MSDEANLSGYFERIGFAGSIAPNLQTLQTLHALHPLAIPFENLNPLLDLPVRLDQKSLEDKLIRERRGGYCYEHNMLLLRVLRTLGFEARGLAARVLWGSPPDAIMPRNHMLLAVELNGSTYLADVGFGVFTPTAPLRLRTGIEQETPHGTFRLTGEDPALRLEAKIGEEWRSLYRFDLSEQYEFDYAALNWYISTYPDSYFRNALMAARVEKAGRITLNNGEFSTYPLIGAGDTRVLASVVELRDVLAGPFGIVLPASDRLDAVLERVLSLSGRD